MGDKDVKDIATQRQLFVDDFWIDKSIGTTRQLHEPIRRDPVIEKDHPWEQGYVGSATVSYVTNVFDGRGRVASPLLPGRGCRGPGFGSRRGPIGGGCVPAPARVPTDDSSDQYID